MSRDSDNPCFKAFRIAMKGKMAKDQIDQTFKSMEESVNETPLDQMAELRAKLLQQADSIVETKKGLDEVRRFQFLQMLQNKKNDLAAQDELKPQKGITGAPKGLFLNLLRIINGTTRGITGAKDSVELRERTVRRRMEGAFLNNAERVGQLDLFNAKLKESEKEIARDILRADKSSLEEGNSLGKAIFHALQEGEQEMRRVGIFFRNLTDRITTNFHDTTKLLQTSKSIMERKKDFETLSHEERREKAFQRWARFTKPLLNPRIFSNLTETEGETFMREGYRTLTNKGSRFPDGEKGIQQQILERQVFNWKDSDAWVEYNQEYGMGNLHDALLRDAQITARRIAKMGRLGNNPEKYIQNFIETVQANPERFGEQRLSQRQRNKVEVSLKAVLGRLNSPDSSLAKVGANVRAHIRLSTLGGLIFTQVTDLPLMSLATRRFYSGWFSATGALLKGFTERATAKEQPFMRDFFRTMVTSETGSLGRIWTDGMETGLLTTAERIQNKLGITRWWDSGWRETLSLLTARHLWHIKDRSFDNIIALDSKFGTDNVRILKAHRITEGDWNAFRRNAATLDDRFEYLVPESALLIPDEEMNALLRDEGRTGFISDADRDVRRKEIRDKFADYIHEVMDQGILRPDAQTKALLAGGLPASSGWGQVVRMLTMYKGWGIMWQKKGFGELLYGRGATSFRDALLGGKGDLAGMAQLLIYAAGMGYISLSLKSLAKGLTPPDPTKPRIIIESLLQGAAPMASLGDLVLKNQEGYARNVLSAAAGPAGRDVIDGLDAFTRGFHGPQAVKSLTDLLRGNIWGANLPGVALALQVMVWEGLQESAHPGSIARHRALLLKETGQQSFIN